MGAAATRCGVPLGAALFNAGERDDGAGERERVRDDGLPSSGAIFGSARRRLHQAAAAAARRKVRKRCRAASASCLRYTYSPRANVGDAEEDGRPQQARDEDEEGNLRDHAAPDPHRVPAAVGFSSTPMLDVFVLASRVLRVSLTLHA